MAADAPRPGSKHATGDWPKAYLLQLYNAAIDHGAIWVQPIDETKAASLRGSFNRLRRRSDTSMAGVITPEMSMVTMGQWQPGPAGTGRVPIMYNKLADGVDLPDIVAMSSGEAVAPMAQLAKQAITPLPVPAATPLAMEQLLDAASMELDASDIEGYVAKMRKAASHE